MKILTKPYLTMESIDIHTGRIVNPNDPKEKWTELIPGRALWGNVLIEFDEPIDMDNVEKYDIVEDDDVELIGVIPIRNVEGTVYECAIDTATLKNPLI